MTSTALPVGWSMCAVGDLGLVRGGKRLPKGRSLQTAPTPHPYVRVTDMRPGGVEVAAIEYVPADVAPLIRAYRIFCDDIFISVAGTLGIVGRVPGQLDGANLTENADRITSIKCDVDYMMYSLLNDAIQREIDAIRTVGAQPKLALGRIKQFQIAVPRTREEQRQIAVALRDCDAYIAALKRMIIKKQAIKQGMMQELLTGRTRLPGFSKVWSRECSVAQVCFRSSGYWGADRPRSPADVGARIIRAGDITPEGTLLGWADRYLTPEEWKKASCKRDDVVVTTSGNGLGKSYYVRRDEPLAASNFVRILRPRPGTSGEFIRYLLQTNIARVKLETHTATSAYPNLLPSFFLDPWFDLPELTEQLVIASALCSVDDALDCLRVRLGKARAIKQGMMQELLTGRTRLPVGEAVA